MKNKIIPYNPKLKLLARQLRKNSTLPEVLLWQNIKQRAYGVQFHRQVPMLEYIADFYCHEIGLVIEIDGESHDHSFLRFSNEEVKKNMFSVLLVIEEKVKELTEQV